MTNPSDPSARYAAFGTCVIDRRRGLFWRDGQLVRLTPKVFDLLLTFVNHSGRLIARDELVQRVWGGVVVEENNIARHISKLRQALHERPGESQYIATVPGSGYRFVAEVRNLDALPAECAPATASYPGPTAPHGEARESDAQRERPFGMAAIFATTLAAISALALASWFWSHQEVGRDREVTRVLRQFTYRSGLQQHPSWSPDGARIAYASNHSGNSDLWVQGIGDSEAVQVTSNPAHDWEPNWSPDSQWLVFRSERGGGGLFVVPAGGGPERQLTGFGVRPQWSPTGTLILFAQASRTTAGTVKMHVVGLDGGPPRAVTHEALAGLRVASATWHPDGRVSFWGRRDGAGWTLVTLALDGGPAVESQLSPEALDALDSGSLLLSELTWARSGRHLFFEGRSGSASNLWRVAVDPSTLHWLGGIDRLTAGAGIDSGVTVSPDGARLAFGVSTSQTAIWAFGFDPIAGKLTDAGWPVTATYPQEMGVDAPPDGRKLVYRASRNERQEVWEQPLGASPRLLLSTSEWDPTGPKWSRDGTLLAYRRTRRGPPGSDAEPAVSILAVERQQERLLVTPPGVTLTPSDWSSDGRSILAACRLAGMVHLGACVLSVADDTPEDRRITMLWADDTRSMMQLRYSPDERWISFITTPRARGVATIYTMPAAGGPWTAVTDGSWYDDKPRWAPDGRTIYFVSNRNGRASGAAGSIRRTGSPGGGHFS